MIPPQKEIRVSLAGAWRLMMFDSGGLNSLNHSVDGFWRSFFAAVVAVPLFLIANFLHTSELLAAPSSGTGVHLFRYTLGWIAFPLVMVVLTRLLNRTHRYASYIIAINWLAVPQWALVLVVSAFGMVLGDSVGNLMPMLLLVLLLSYDFFITRIVLELTVGKATLVVTIGVLLAVLLDTLILGML